MGGGSPRTSEYLCTKSDVSVISNIGQFDGVNSMINSSSSSNNQSDSESDVDDNDDTEYDTENEVEPDTSPIMISPVKKPKGRQLKVLKASSLPLVTLLNARSLYNKHENFKTFMTELGIEAAIVSETWERDDKTLENLLHMSNYKVHSHRRTLFSVVCGNIPSVHRRTKVKANRQPGGACALVYNENRFKVTD